MHRTPHAVITLTIHYDYGDQFFEQTEGTAMGPSLSPVVAGLFMEDFEQMALVTADREPKLWLRYVDDTFIVWPHGRTELATFLDHLNSLCEKIQLTMEIEEENQLPFLDVLVKRNEYTNSPRGTEVCGVPCLLRMWLSLCWLNRRVCIIPCHIAWSMTL